MKEFSKIELESIGIYNLRNYARRLGVKAPTKKVKKVLIDEIMKIYSKELFPAKQEAKGRKAKNRYPRGEGIPWKVYLIKWGGINGCSKNMEGRK